MTGLNRKLIWTVILGLVTVVLVSFLADFEDTVQALKSFKAVYLPFILILTFINYLLRFVKWQFFLKQLDIEVPLNDSFAIFLSGLAMSVTPGKVGELLKSLLLKEIKGVPISRTAPIIFAERLSDGFALLVLSLSGLLTFAYGREALAAITVVMVVVLIAVSTPSLYNPLIRRCSRLPLVNKFTGVLENLTESVGQLMKPKALLFTVFLGIVSWSFECLAFYLVFIGLGYKVSVLSATFVLA
ncbi:MAG TPA: lysylphosphatidylglycerol synthase transmembrane domain-containing protein, partial [Desulfobacteria bacterium]|nr:lysylphosphatidylglycerol synthase transmembrane domain-containing protein [Desulfobacteria bacterium]